MPGRLRLNLLANVVGRVWAALSVYVFVPFYIDALGAERYGVVAFYAVLLGLFALANFGLPATLSRELARLSASADGQAAMRTTSRTLELVFWGIGLGVAALVAALAPWLARDWIQADSLPTPELTGTIVLMGLALGLRFPTELCLSGLSGLEQQVWSNGIRAGFGTARGLVALLALHMIAPTVEVFFLSQVLVNLVEAVAASRALWWTLPKGDLARFALGTFKELWRYAAGLSGISLLAVVFSQLDKLVVSRALSLEEFSHYSVAALASRIPLLASGPIEEAFAPRLARLVATSDPACAVTYQRACQLVSIVTVPPALLFAFHAELCLGLWIQDRSIAVAAAAPAALLVLGTLCMAFQGVPFRLALAHAHTSLNLKINSIALVLFVPALLILTYQLGAVGAALTWLLLNALNMLPFVAVLHRRFLPPGATRLWATRDVGLPLIAATGAGFLTLLFVPSDGAGLAGRLSYLAFAGALMFLATVVATPISRSWLVAKYQALNN